MSFSSVAHLAGRYPELVNDPAFARWLTQFPSTTWHETSPDETNHVDVVVQADDGIHILGAKLWRDTSQIDRGIITHKLIKVVEIAMPAGSRRADVEQQARALVSTTAHRLVAIRPL